MRYVSDSNPCHVVTAGCLSSSKCLEIMRGAVGRRGRVDWAYCARCKGAERPEKLNPERIKDEFAQDLQNAIHMTTSSEPWT